MISRLKFARFWVILLLLIINQGCKHESDKREAITERDRFALNHAPELLASLRSLIEERDLLRKRINHLESRLRSFNRLLDSDSEYVLWRQAERSATTAIAELENRLIDAFLLHEKYILSSDINIDAEIQSLLDRGLSDAHKAEILLASLHGSPSSICEAKIEIRRAIPVIDHVESDQHAAINLNVHSRGRVNAQN